MLRRALWFVVGVMLAGWMNVSKADITPTYTWRGGHFSCQNQPTAAAAAICHVSCSAAWSSCFAPEWTDGGCVSGCGTGGEVRRVYYNGGAPGNTPVNQNSTPTCP